jgi:hypothetical protein
MALRTSPDTQVWITKLGCVSSTPGDPADTIGWQPMRSEKTSSKLKRELALMSPPGQNDEHEDNGEKQIFPGM